MMLRFNLTLLMFSVFTIANGQNYRWVQFIKAVSGSPEESITRVVYNDEFVYALGEFSKNITNATDTVKIHHTGRSSCFIAKFDTSGTQHWIKAFGSKSYDTPKDLIFADGKLFASVYLQGDTIYFDNHAFKRDPLKVSHIIRFNADGEYERHIATTDSEINRIEQVDTMLYFSRDKRIGKLDRDLNLLGNINFAGSSYVTIENLHNVNDTSLIVSGFFGKDITYGGVTAKDTFNGAGDAAFLAYLNVKDQLLWLTSFGNVYHNQNPLQLAYASGSSVFYLSDNFIDAFRIKNKSFVPSKINVSHGFIASFDLNGNIKQSGVFHPLGSTSGTGISNHFVLTNNNNVFVGGRVGYSKVSYNFEDTLSFGRPGFGMLYKLDTELNMVWKEVLGPATNSGQTDEGVIIDDQLFIAARTIGTDTKIGCEIFNDKGAILYHLEDKPSENLPAADFTFVKQENTIFTTADLKNYDYFSWDFDDGSPLDTTRINPVHTFQKKGAFDITLTAGNPCGSEVATKRLEIDGLRSLDPAYTAQNNLYIGRLSGAGLTEGAEFKLVNKTGAEKEILNARFIDSSSYMLVAEFDNDPLASYDLIMSNGNRSDTLQDALEVVEDEPYDIRIYFNGPPVVLAGAEFYYNITIENKSNKTAYGVPFAIAGESHHTFLMLDDPTLQNSLINEWLDVTGGHWLDINTGSTEEFKKVAFFIIPVLKAGERIRMSFSLITEAGDGRISAFYNEPLFAPNDFVDRLQDSTECPVSPVVESIVEGFGLPFNYEGTYNFSRLGCIIWDYLDVGINGNDPPAYLDGASSSGDVLDMGPLLGEDMLDDNPGRDKEDAVDSMKELMDRLPDNYNEGYENLSCEVKECPDLEPIVSDDARTFDCEKDECPELVPLPGSDDDEDGWKMDMDEFFDYLVVNSLDPNEKYGLVGSDGNGFIAQGRDLFYRITFENSDSATAPANTVYIYDTLDVEVLDTSTFEWLSVGFGDTLLNIISTGRNVIRDINVSNDGTNIVVRFKGHIDDNGVLIATFSSLDPVTLSPVQNPFDGFLPPNINAPEGEGFIEFRISQKEGLTHQTRIANKASIVFDFNEPIATSTVTNYIDQEAPTTSVVPFSHTTHEGQLLRVDLQGHDDGSGMQGYNVYMRVNEGRYQQIAYRYPDNHINIKVDYDSTYAFIAQGVDNVGNVESKEIRDEAQITIKKSTSVNKQTNSNFKITIYPNPVDEALYLNNSGSTRSITYRIVDITGKVIDANTIYIVNENRVVNVSGLKSGFYVLEISTDPGYLQRIRFLKK